MNGEEKEQVLNWMNSLGNLDGLSEEQVCDKLKLPNDIHEKYAQKIIKIMTEDKVSFDVPTAIINMAPPGSGKTGLNNMGKNQLKNVVIINSDELKKFHPLGFIISKKYPVYYTKITNQESNSWNDRLFDVVVDNKYNLVYESTGRNLKLLRKIINKLKSNNYNIVIRGLIVNDLNCLMSILERYEKQQSEMGWGRLVTKDHFYKAYEEFVNNIEIIENEKLADNIELYVRTDNPDLPKKYYSSNQKKFENIRVAIEYGRKNDYKKAKIKYRTKFNRNNYIRAEEKDILDRISVLDNVEYCKE